MNTQEMPDQADLPLSWTPAFVAIYHDIFGHYPRCPKAAPAADAQARACDAVAEPATDRHGPS